MEAEKTYPQTIVPEKTENYKIISISIIPDNKNVRVELTDQNSSLRIFEANLSDEWDTVSGSNKTIIKTFLRRIAAIAIATGDENITGDALP